MILTFLGLVLIIYGVLWLMSIKKYSVEYGISFDKNHATYLGLDWKKTYLVMLDDLKPKYIRLAAKWDEIEKTQGKFTTADLDWQMNEAGKRGVKVTLVVGQKTPRWPECHMPEWAKLSVVSCKSCKLPVNEYIKYVVEKYKNHPALEIWQIENEPFIKFAFGECKRFDGGLVEEEVALLRSLDNNHKIMLTDSGEMGVWYGASRLGDIFGTTLYRVVRSPNGSYFKYDWMPAGLYKLKARILDKGYNEFFVSELQVEPWLNGIAPKDMDIAEQEKSLDIIRLQKNIDYASRVGASRVYFWGVEWWYWMKEKNNDSRYWEIIQKLNEN